jgi:hypothetical protein
MKAFPVVAHNSVYSSGMDLRDWFAGMALQGMHASITDASAWPSKEGLFNMAQVAYIQADAMMKAREKQSNG